MARRGRKQKTRPTKFPLLAAARCPGFQRGPTFFFPTKRRRPLLPADHWPFEKFGLPKKLGKTQLPKRRDRRHDTRRGLAPRPLRDPRADRRGRDGEVYRARDTRLERTVAIKVLPEHLSDEPRSAPAVRAGGEDDLAAFASAHLRALRRGQPGRCRVPRHGISRGGDAGRASCEGAAAPGADAALRGGDRGCAGSRSPAGDRAP